MTDKGQEATQKLSKGTEVPVPKRKNVLDALRKGIQPKKRSGS